MIFVTVGTHEQPFDRLVKYMDGLKKKIVIEDIIIQTGFSTYEPKYCKWKKFFSYQEMLENVEAAHIVITHGGPSSFIMPLQLGKIPIVVPRQKEFNEHVNSHQIDFCNIIAERMKNIIIVRNIDNLEDIVLNYKIIIEKMPYEIRSNNKIFMADFMKLVDDVFSS